MGREPLISEQNAGSRRWAVVADEGDSVWLYLTEPDRQRPVADCWLLNTIPAPDDVSAYRSAKSAPAATREFAGAGAHGVCPDARAVRFQWSSDGESVAVFVAEELLGFIASGQRRGFSRHLIAEGPFGHPLDQQLYSRVFHE
jgi:hypothetical protein